MRPRLSREKGLLGLSETVYQYPSGLVLVIRLQVTLPKDTVCVWMFSNCDREAATLVLTASVNLKGA